MIITSNNILPYILSNNIAESKKLKFIKNNKTRIITELKKLSAKDLISFLFNKDLIEEVKLIIVDEIDCLEYDNNATSKLKINNIKNVLSDDKYLKLEYLASNYVPRILKKILVDKFYSRSIISFLNDTSIPFNIKSTIIDVTDDETIIKLLRFNIDNQIIDYIILNRINTIDMIKHALSEDNIDDVIKNKIIIDKINIDNIFLITKSALVSVYQKNKIYNLKQLELDEYINSLNHKNVLQTLCSYSISPEIKEKIVLEKKREIITAGKWLSVKKLCEYLKNIPSLDANKILIDNNRLKSRMVVEILSCFDILDWLNNKNLPLEFKEYIILRKSNQLNKAISNLSFSDILLFHLNSISTLPNSIQQLIFDEKKDLIIQKVNEEKESVIITYLLYGHCSELLKKVMIDQRINKNNIFGIINRCFYECINKDEIIDLIIKTKAQFFKEYLSNLSLDDLVTLKCVEISYIRDKIILFNSSLIIDILKNVDNDELYSCLKNSEVLFSVKIIILKRFGVNSNDINNYLELIKYNDCDIVFDNYEKIKSFFSKINISFESFIQYGCGSNLYKDILINLVQIINNNKESDFICISNYLFDNYYTKYTSEENVIEKISDFMEILHNFNRYYQFLLNITNNKASLTDIDKVNINFLFKLNSSLGTNIMNLNEINTFRIKMYDKYREIIKTAKLDELKEIFNNIVLLNANEILENVGGTEGLKNLRKFNYKNKNLCILIDELILYSKIVEVVNDAKNEEKLRNVLKLALCSTNLIEFQNIFSKLNNKVKRVFELDSRINLTEISSIKNKRDIIDDRLCLSYGGNVYNFSDKTYVLYAHIIGSKENIEDLILGKATSKNNFISVSPISYLGQKYYYDYSEMILAYDYIPKGSFVCSSILNMSTNDKIRDNSLEVQEIKRHQRGILETSSVKNNNSEALLYRERLRPCGLILPGGRTPSDIEMEYHKKYQLPFIITQPLMSSIDNPKFVFGTNTIDDKIDCSNQIGELKKFLFNLNSNLEDTFETAEYTGREIAIITDAHAMYEPTVAALEQIRRKGIKEIYSLGDNIGLGPNPCEVFDLMSEYGVKSVAGNSEYYNTLGIEPFSYFDLDKIENQNWTYDKLGSSRIKKMSLYPPSFDILVGTKKVALCHFINDIRWDFVNNSTWKYQMNFIEGESSKQFLYTNSEEAKLYINNYIENHDSNDKKIAGYVSYKERPLFEGKCVNEYDAIIQGHVHFDINDYLNNTRIYTLRAVGMGYGADPKESACYYILKEKKDGSFDIQKCLVEYNKNVLISNIHASSLPHKEKILNFLV